MPAPLESHTNTHRQGFDHYAIYSVGAHKVRIRIHQDTSYAAQSSAVAEVWSPVSLSWNECGMLHYGEWAALKGGSTAVVGTTGLWEAEDKLLGQAVALLTT